MSPSGPRRRLLATAVGLCLVATLLAGLVVGAVPGGPDEAAVLDDGLQPRIVDMGNTSNHLQPERGDASRDAVARQESALSIAVASGAESLHGHHHRLAFDERFQNAPNESAQLETFQAAVTDLAERTAAHRDAQADARRAFRTGAISGSDYFRRLALLSAETDRLVAQRARLEQHVGEVGTAARPSVTRLQNLEADLETANGPVANAVLARYAGNASAGTTLVSVTESGGFVTATVGEETFYRVAQAAADWNRDDIDQFESDSGSGGLSQALERAATLYPWTFSNQFGSPPPRGVFGDTVLYKIAVIHQHGELTVYLDGSTEGVFREVQHKRLGAFTRNWSRTTSASGLNLTVNGTYGSGQLGVHVTDAVTSDGVRADVRIDDTLLGRSGPDGQLQTVQPYGAFTVNATTTANESVTLTIPADPT